MAIVLQLTDVVAAADFGPIEMPSLAKCRAYHLLGGSQAQSVANRVNAGQPLSVTGAPTYETAAAILTTTAGLARPVQSSAYDRTTFVVFADPYLQSTPAPSEPTLASLSDDISILWWNAQFNGFFLFGTTFKLRPRSDSGTSDVNTGPYNASQDRPWLYPDGTVQQGGFRMAVVRQRAADASLWVQNGTILPFIGTASRDDTMNPSLATKIAGIGGAATARLRVAAFAEFTALTDAEVAAVADFIAADVEARGIDFWGRTTA